MLNELPKKNYINCEHFSWWDGDYCCTDKFKILQESKNGKFNEDILFALENNMNCSKWKLGRPKITEMYMEAFNEFMNNRK